MTTVILISALTTSAIALLLTKRELENIRFDMANLKEDVRRNHGSIRAIEKKEQFLITGVKRELERNGDSMTMTINSGFKDVVLTTTFNVQDEWVSIEKLDEKVKINLMYMQIILDELKTLNVHAKSKSFTGVRVSILKSALEGFTNVNSIMTLVSEHNHKITTNLS